MAIRLMYEKYGVDTYYKNHSKEYENPHKKEIIDIIKNIEIKHTDKILDLSCGDGLITETLLELGYNNIKGCDPYMCDIYKKKTKKECYNYDFIDIINNKMTEQFDIVICSFALHLCDEKNLFSLINQLKYFNNIKKLYIITPHKKPNLNNICSLDKTFITKTLKGKKIYLKIYNI